MSFDKVEVRVFSGPDQVQVGSNTEPDLIVMNIGPKGDAGTAATVTVGTTTTLAPGSSATVANAGTSSAAVFNFGIPTGATGATGAAGANGGSSTAWRYRAKTNATSGYPTNGHLLWNNAMQVNATEILVSHLDDEGSDIELFLSFFAEGQKLFIQNRDDSSQNQIWEITGTPTVTNPNTSTSYYTFPVTLVSSQGGAFTNNHSILFGTITVATNSVTSATTSDGTADLNLLEVSTGVLVVSDSFTLSKEIVSGLQTKMTFTANPTAVGDGQQIIWQWYNGGSPITTAAISSESTGSTSDKLIFKTSQGGSVATSLDLTYALATFSGSISSLGESYRAASTFTYATGVAATHRTALGLTTLATTTAGTNVANFLEFPTSANLASALTDENGTGGGFVRAEGASLTTPTLVGTPVFNATAYTYGAGAAAAHRDALGVAGKQSKTTTSAVTSTNAVAADISDLTGFNLEANTTYRLTLHSIITTSSGGSFEFFFIASGTTYQGGTAQVGSGIQRSGGVVAGGYHYNTTSFSPLYATQNLTNGHTYGEYYFRTSGTAGTAKMQFSQRSSAIAGTTTVAAGATAILEKIS